MRFTFNAATAALSILCLAAIAFGAPPEIVELSPIPRQVDPKPVTIPDTLSVGKYRWLGITNYEGVVTWQVDSTAAITFETDAPTKMIGTVEGQNGPTLNDIPAKALVLYGKAEGVTRVEAWGVVEGRAKRLASKVFGGEGPRPPPEPDPKPKPDPVPVASKVFLRLVEETSERTPAMAILASSQGYWDTVQASGNRFQWYDQNTKEASGKKAIADAGAITAPMVIVYDLATEKKIGAEALDRATVTTATIDAIIKKYTGAK